MIQTGAGGCPLRLVASRRSTSPAFQAEEERDRHLSSSKCEALGGGGSRRSRETEGAAAVDGDRLRRQLCIQLQRQGFEGCGGLREGGGLDLVDGVVWRVDEGEHGGYFKGA